MESVSTPETVFCPDVSAVAESVVTDTKPKATKPEEIIRISRRTRPPSQVRTCVGEHCTRLVPEKHYFDKADEPLTSWPSSTSILVGRLAVLPCAPASKTLTPPHLLRSRVIPEFTPSGGEPAGRKHASVAVESGARVL